VAVGVTPAKAHTSGAIASAVLSIAPAPAPVAVTTTAVSTNQHNAGTAASSETRPQPIASSDNTLAEAWFVVVEQLVTAQKIQAMTRELAMQSQCVQREATRWVLQVERESLVSPANVERLQNALHEAGHSVTLVTQIGDVTDSPAIRLAQKQQQRLSDVEEEILNDPVVQQLITEFDAKIVPGSIKTLTH
jgi:DNA polymerase-3 subunit gamma/tau